MSFRTCISTSNNCRFEVFIVSHMLSEYLKGPECYNCLTFMRNFHYKIIIDETFFINTPEHGFFFLR